MKPATYFVEVNRYPGKGELTVLFSGSAQTEPSHKVGPQVLDYFLIHYILSGKGTFSCMGKQYDLLPGDSFVIFPGELVSYESDAADPWSYRWVGFKGSMIDLWLSSMGISLHQPVIPSSGLSRRTPVLFRQVQDSLRSGHPSSDFRSNGYMRLLLGELSAGRSNLTAQKPSPQTEMQQQMEQAVRWLTLQYSQPVSIDRLAQSLGYHRTHFSKIFKRYTGLSPIHFLLKIRMERAKHLLLGPLTIEQVASSVGFPDPLYFSKQFRKWYGQSPSEYRNAYSGPQQT